MFAYNLDEYQANNHFNPQPARRITCVKYSVKEAQQKQMNLKEQRKANSRKQDFFLIYIFFFL